MSDKVLADFVGGMSVADFCARLGCSVEDLLERGAKPGAEPPKSEVAEPVVAKPQPSTPNLLDPLMALPLREARAEFERWYILRILEENGDNRAAASRRAGVVRSVIYQILSRPVNKVG